MGTGTGVLAIAAWRRWGGTVLAVDNDEIAVSVTDGNLGTNNIPHLMGGDGVLPLLADTPRDPNVSAHGPFDLILANILAKPLIEMAPALATVLAPGGVVMLAGLLTTQEHSVRRAYEDAGLIHGETLVRGDWSILSYVKGSG